MHCPLTFRQDGLQRARARRRKPAPWPAGQDGLKAIPGCPLSMGRRYISATSERREKEERSYLAQFIMVLILSLVLVLIVDLDRAQDGLMLVPHHALSGLQRQLNAGQ